MGHKISTQVPIVQGQACSSVVEQVAHDDSVVGSNPTTLKKHWSTKAHICNGRVFDATPLYQSQNK